MRPRVTIRPAQILVTLLLPVAWLPLLIVGPASAQPAPLSESTESMPERTTAFIPVASLPDRQRIVAENSDASRRVCRPDASRSIDAWEVDGWRQYQRLWEELSQKPDSPALRRYLGLPIGKAADQNVVIHVKRGRSAPRWMGWRAGSYLELETPHLTIYSRADEQSSRDVAADLEQVYWIWTQVFFPLWDAQPEVATHLKPIDPTQTIESVLADSSLRLKTRQRLRIVLFRDANEYARSLGRTTPGIEQSTGMYSDERRTSFFYPSDAGDAVATRRHELAHQLFREASRSRLGDQIPGEASGFWLIEGIAGYFESMQVADGVASLGGWDSPRLQYARYRILSGNDLMAFSELSSAGRAEVQSRSDLARWYAHAIAQTHHLFDGPDLGSRRWIYEQLAELYQIDLDVPGIRRPTEPEQSLRRFLAVDDRTLIDHPARREIKELCLAGCNLSPTAIDTIAPSSELRWLDLSRIPVDSRSVARLCPSPDHLEQLSLEATAVDNALATWLEQADNLTELDLSWTACGDPVVDAIDDCQRLNTLWMTGSGLTDRCLPTLLMMRAIESIDLQRTSITADGLATARRRRPDWNLNSLQLRVE
ncbi:hypothetical protein FYK55_07895 [Roseiconus nitratireducens]|uniref:Leucine Rich repeats (2 copies) n=1 Tax=Roseiconus nitratireducens TaxID=2605748 RepID=A0A5M6DDA4_9BACT|nr:hypothetical protein [Roseiconus nitratireducens]KAA5545551.1 hypothetical protein FYK55_07895 [Roseiconus nitratireducens]